jgi:hypothetical protein
MSEPSEILTAPGPAEAARDDGPLAAFTPSLSDAQWLDVLRACEGNPLHWGPITAADYPEARPLRLVFGPSAGEPVACALAYVSPLRRWRFLPAGRDLELPTAPAVADGDRRPERKRGVLRALVDYARAHGYRRLIVRPRFGDALDELPELAPYHRSATFEFVVDLARDWDAVVAGMHRFHRKNVRRAERDTVEVVSDPTVAGLLALRDLQLASSRRSAERGGGFRVRETAYFDAVQRNVYGPGFGDVLFARVDGEVLAGLAYVAVGDRGITVRSGSTPAGYERLAMYRLQASVLEAAHRRGLRALNLGGVPAEAGEEAHVQHGLYAFKRGFGGAERLCRGLEIPLDRFPR